MARQERGLVDGGYYHIITRGIDRRRLFKTIADYECFLGSARVNLNKFDLHIFHYCLMPNHIHLLIKVGKVADLPKFMQVLLQSYAHYFRKKYRSTGFVFQNRYKSKYINNDAYLLECGRYIERNPLRAQLILDINAYRWSSYLFYANGSEDAIIKTMNPLYIALADVDQRRRELYVRYVSETRPYEDMLDRAFHIK